MRSEQGIFNLGFRFGGRRAWARSYLGRFALAWSRRNIIFDLLGPLKKPPALAIGNDFGHRQWLERVV